MNVLMSAIEWTLKQWIIAFCACYLCCISGCFYYASNWDDGYEFAEYLSAVYANRYDDKVSALTKIMFEFDHVEDFHAGKFKTYLIFY